MTRQAPLAGDGAPLDPGLRALCGIAAYYRIGADPVQLQRELALGGRLTDEPDLIRAAQKIGMRARSISGADAARLGRLPTPAIVRLQNGGPVVYAGRAASGLCRLVDPISHAATEMPADELARETDGRALLIARKRGEPAYTRRHSRSAGFCRRCGATAARSGMCWRPRCSFRSSP